jgi:Fe-S oxidoreductase
MRNLDAWARRGVPVIVLEPSCLSALNDDLPDLIDDAELGRRVAAIVQPADKAIEALPQKIKDKIKFDGDLPPILVHGHCHQKSLEGTLPVHRLLRLGGAKSKEIPSGCCGMAGSFGYEAEHYEISQKIGEERLFKAVRESTPDTILVANGFSCRHQVEEATGRKPLHFAEVFGRAVLGKLNNKA